MSKTFKCVEHEEEVLEVYPFTGEEGGRKFSLLMPHVSSNAGIAFDSTTAPALALAILEAAGHTEDDRDDSCLTHFAIAMTNLRLGIAQQERTTAEAEAQAKLEAEALELFRASQCIRTDGMYASVPSFAQLSDPSKPKWLAVARRARELNKEEK